MTVPFSKTNSEKFVMSKKPNEKKVSASTKLGHTMTFGATSAGKLVQLGLLGHPGGISSIGQAGIPSAYKRLKRHAHE
jgi:hypothetical protein